MTQDIEKSAVANAAVGDWALSPSQAVTLIGKGKGSRLIYSLLSGIVALSVIPWPPIAAWLALVATWEFAARPFLERLAIAPAPARSRDAMFRWLACLHLVGSAAYTVFPAMAWSTNTPLGMVLATAWVTGSANHAFVYFSHHRELLLANVLPLLACALLAPFAAAGGLTPAGALGVLILGSLIALAGFIGRDRNALMQALAAQASARTAAEQANAFKSQFLAGMGHELRAPLTDIQGYAELIEEEAEGPLAEDARKIKAAAVRMLGVVTAVLDIARLEAGNIVLHPERTRVSAVLEQVREAALPLALANRNRLIVGDADGEIEIDHARLHQALMQIITHAAKHVSDGELRVGAAWRERENRNLLVFEIVDTGADIPEGQEERMFEAFAEGTGRVDGAGLGLSFARQMARLMGGDAACERAPGGGGKFTLWVPPGGAD
ncbi:MAG: HAMP domain-containing sensor histidine kinase [Hyphomonadaceae bacterium]